MQICSMRWPYALRQNCYSPDNGTWGKLYEWNNGGNCFSWKTQLISHQATHTSDKLYEYKVCGKSFHHTSSFTILEKTHWRKKKHEISHVENSLQEVPGQQILENSYMEKKTHECNECGKTFLNIAHLIVVFKIKTMRSWRDGGKGKLFITQIEDMNSVG